MGKKSIPPEEKRHFYSIVGETFSDASWFRDMSTGEGYWMAAQENMKKYNLPDAAFPVEDFLFNVHDEDRERVRSKAECLLNDKTVTIYEHEFRYKGKDRYYFIRDKVKIDRNDTGTPVRCFGVWMDITDFHDRHQVLERMLVKQESLNHELLEFQDKLTMNEDSLQQINEKLKANLEVLSSNEFVLNKSQQITKSGSWEIRIETGAFTCSEEFALTHGIQRHSFIKSPACFFDMLYGADVGVKISAGIEKIRSKGEPFDIVFDYVTEAGNKKWINLIAYPFYKQDTVSEIIGVATDITSFKETEERLKASEEKFFTVFKFTPDLLTLSSESDGVLVEVNDKVFSLTGYTEKEVLGKTIQELNLWVDPAELAYFLQEYPKYHQAFAVAWWRKKDEQLVYVLVSSVRVTIGGKDFRLSLVKDISEQKETEDLLRKSEANLNATINNTKMLIWSIDQNYMLLTCNEATRQYVKASYNVDLEVGDSLDEKVLKHAVDKETEIYFRSMYERALAGESVLENYVAFGRHVELSMHPIQENGKVTGLTAFAFEITERIAHQEEVIKNYERLAEAEKRIGELKLVALRSAMNPHFIFNALNSIQYFISNNDKTQAIQYLSTFSKLIRGILSGSAQNAVRLADELELLRHYTNLELVRFENKFTVEFYIDSEVDKENIEVPSLLLQPFVENAILHGLCNKQQTGTLKIGVKRESEDLILFEIEDDGIGRAAAKALMSNKKQHRSMGILLAEERLRIVNNKRDLSVQTEDLYEGDEPAGTKVKIWLQIHN